MHWYADFHDPPSARAGHLFQWAGGFPALLRLTRRFYEVHIPQDPLLSGLFSQMSPDHPERVASWLGQVFGGPPAYSERYGEYDRMISQHLDKALTSEQRARWVLLLARSADETGLPADAEFRAAFTAYLEWGSRIALENSQPGVHPPPHMPVPRWWWVCDAYPWSRPHATCGARARADASAASRTRTSRSPTTLTSSRCSASATATRCASRSICGPTPTSALTRTRSRAGSGPGRCHVTAHGRPSESTCSNAGWRQGARHETGPARRGDEQRSHTGGSALSSAAGDVVMRMAGPVTGWVSPGLGEDDALDRLGRGRRARRGDRAVHVPLRLGPR